MTQDAMQKIVDKIGRQGVYTRLGAACALLEKYLFLRSASEMFDLKETLAVSQRGILETVAEVDVLIDILCNTCMTMSERYEVACMEEFKCGELVNEILGDDAE